jgi:hypothetical protein
MHGRSVDRPLQCSGEELPDLESRQGPKVEPFGQAVLPEGDNGIGRHRARAECGQNADAVLGGEQMGERRRVVVEEVGVVDENGHRLPFAPSGHPVCDLAQHLERTGAGGQIGHEGREGPEGKTRRPLGAGDVELDEPRGRRG